MCLIRQRTYSFAALFNCIRELSNSTKELSNWIRELYNLAYP